MYKFDTISTNELSLREASLRDASHALLAINIVNFDNKLVILKVVHQLTFRRPSQPKQTSLERKCL